MLSARTCAEIRAGIVGYYSSPVGARLVDALALALSNRWTTMTARQVADEMARTVSRSSLWWFSPEMVDLVSESAPTLSGDVSIPTDMMANLDSPNGLCFFAHPIEVMSIEGPPIHISAVHWFPQVRTDTKGTHYEISIDYYGVLDGRMLPCGGSQWEHDERLDAAPNASGLEDRRLLMAVLALLSSPGITTVDRRHPDRPTARRLERQAPNLTNVVRVVYLSGSDNEHIDHHHHASPHHHHRWAVRGHWRNQPYGPMRSLRKPVWVRSHIKGPSDAPMMTGTIVRALTHAATTTTEDSTA